MPFCTSFFLPPHSAKRLPLRRLLAAIAAGLLASCASPPRPVITDVPDKVASRPGDDVATPSVILKNKSRWVKADWADLPGVSQDNLNDAWVAWLQSCSRVSAANSAICQSVKRHEGQSVAVQRAWLTQTFQPYRVESLQESSAAANGLLTAYYEPIFEASRTPKPGFTVPLYGPPANLKSRSPWFTREEITQLPAAQNALKGKEIAFIADPIDAMVLHIQGSGRLWLNQSDGRRQQIRLAFAGTNEQPYQSIGRWLLDQNLTKDATWPGIKKWLAQNPKRTQELLAKNPRFVFFKEEPLNGQEALLGPKGAQGVPLTPGRSIAVDPGSIPYGTPVWLASQGPQTTLHRLVLAQDTGSAIQGAVRADFYAGSGDAAGELAGRLKQDMKAWVLLPR